ncbi:DUF3060 domain-containing protein [Phycicoccus sp. HDW14]|uniref:DUF3060 domain-containing protein n=1 Tax=Phycicoccus sp. HDW14 TaxID=2714941 RepID=UPI0014085655|nr:DUF3060 domain-containing protein [Phycicoccus sp. HDW14]QIM22514.1 DUF3060 domain-containing protein [Phycicoccus sp. HDW14]
MTARRQGATVALALLGSAVALAGCGVTVVRDDATPARSSASTPPPTSPTSSSSTAPPAPGPTEVPGTTAGSDAPQTYAGWAEEIRGAATLRLPCDRGPVSVDTAATVVELVGSCGQVSVDAAGASVLADHIDTLTVTGAQVVVVTRTLGSVTLDGSADEVYWVGGVPTVTNRGAQNLARTIEEDS